jgi:hypothetical protein
MDQRVDEMSLAERLEQLLEKWRQDRATYPEQSFGAKWAATAVELCERELRDVLHGS